MSVTGNAAASVPISTIPPGAYSSAIARARRNKINDEPMQRIISSAIALGLLIVGLCFLYLELFAEPAANSNNLMLGGFSVVVGAAGLFVDFVSSFLLKHHDE